MVSTTPSPMIPPAPRAGQVLQKDGTFSQPWSGFFQSIYRLFNLHGAQITNVANTANQAQQDVQTLQQSLAAGIGATVALAPLTGGGHAGSMTFHNGILTAYVAPT